MLADQFPYVFQGTGKLSEPYHLQIDPSAKPVVHPTRKVPLALKTALKEELDLLESLQILTPVSEPTPWVSNMVIVKKPNGNRGRLPFTPSIRVEILGVNTQCCSLSKRKLKKSEDVLVSIGKFKRKRQNASIKPIAYNF